jgi:tRNA(Ile)-lysidine synthase
MKTLSPLATGSSGLFAHWRRFIQQMKLIPASGRVYVAISGGVDSVVLLYLTSLLRPELLSEVRAVHFHHGLRDESDQEVLLVKQLCQKLDTPLDIHYLNLNYKEPNLELAARSKRYQILLQLAGPKDLIYTGHQIDDSFEWSLMQQLKSSSSMPTLGIPLINGRVARPNLCLTKNQIYHIAKKAGLKWSEDHTNSDSRFDRNYIRTFLIPQIKRRFPSYLKHYVFRSNQLALKLGVAQIGHNSQGYCVRGSQSGGVTIFGQKLGGSLIGAQELVREEICRLSSSTRGSIASQVDKLVQGSEQGFKGPYAFSGQVEGFSSWGELHLARKGVAPRSKEVVELDLLSWQQLDLATFKQKLEGAMAQPTAIFPMICLIEGGEMGAIPSIKIKSYNNFTPYLELRHQEGSDSENGRYKLVSALKLLQLWERASYSHRSLRVALLG